MPKLDACDRCHKPVLTEFMVTDALWAKVTGHHKPVDDCADGYWCIPCFITAAEALGDCDFTMLVYVRADYVKG